ncbi:hypothetical protein CLV77_1275 [Brevirhabdus pacifica]|uniref:AbrB family transcriptional regulator n=1 Tax=Brevirhabdus pacifica TaxID=1267768 RepID=UPI000CB62486|nr:AbrB family transcriptional regulator [Brevirhabdus pacifica]PJJ86719.1 hypothetical protein CLV77_1275 [Brevirhabdus pacifica]
MTVPTWLPRLNAFVIASAGAALFSLLGLPLPFLFGPMCACLFAALAGVPMRGLGQVSVAARTILGVAVGASLTVAVVMQLPRMLPTLALIPVYIAVIAAVGVPFFTRLCGFDRVTAFYAAMPGGLQDMVIFGQEAGGNVRSLSLVHATRVLIIISLVPLLLNTMFDRSLDQPIGAPAAQIPLWDLVLMTLAALAGWKIGERLGLFGASILGPMFATAALALTGLITHRPPAEAILAAQFFIGTGIGVHYVGVTFDELRRVVLSAVAFVAVLALLAAAFTEALVLLELAPAVDIFLAYAPGGQAEMTVLAIVAGADLGFVIVHHLARIVLVIIGAPLVARVVLRRRPNDASRR